MAIQTMYPPQNNGVSTELTVSVNASATSITVSDATVLPAPPNVLSLGGGDDTELVKLVSVTGNILTIERGFNDTVAKSWDADTKVFRGITAQDVSALQNNVNEVDGKADSHAARHGQNGADPLSASDIGAMAEDATPTPASHASSHGSGGADPVVRMWNKTLLAADWSGGVQDVTLPVTSANAVFIEGASSADMAAIANANMSIVHITGGLRFTAATTPASDIALIISAV